MPTHTTLPGFRDFFPPDFTVRSHIVEAWRDVARRYGFEEYDGPPLESLELYTEKSGDEIVRQLYNFEDKGGRAVALRPEMTPTLARMVGARAGALRKPIRWFAVPQLFRYERMQRGRLREHFQWNVDILGEDDIAADAEVLAVALDGLRQLGLEAADVVARFNDRRLLEIVLPALGVPSGRIAATYSVVDKLGREPAERIRERLVDEAGQTPATADRLLDLFESVRASGETGGLDVVRSAFPGAADVARELDRLDAYQDQLAALGFGAFTRFDPAIVRGLAYYTGTVFEVFDRQGEMRAVCGGGRYDRLLASVSGADLPGVGFGMGDVVLGELLRDRALLPSTEPAVDAFLVLFEDESRPLLLSIAQALRGAGFSVLYALRNAAVGRQLKEANARGARRVILLGPDEVRRGAITLRVMATGEQRELAVDTLLARPAGLFE
ncbi:MAG TPA: histidine--tRNA ligase [Longimicrobiales bacterium]|nr:histidine--tRNA ligase [Longimicrobiales bacterium]